MGVWNDIRLWSDCPVTRYDEQTGKQCEEPGTSTLKTTTMRIVFALLVAFAALFFGFLFCYYVELKPKYARKTSATDSESFM